MWPADAGAFTRLREWLEEAGAGIGPVRVEHYSESNRGLCAAADLAAGQRVLEIPRARLLTADMADESDVRRRLDEAGVRLAADNSYLAAFLLRERHDPQSGWKPFLDVLPASYPDSPLLFGEGDLAMLQASFALRDIEMRRRAVAGDYDALCRCVPGFERFSLEEFFWGFCTVTSRLFGLTMGERTIHALAPLADLCNHRKPPELSWAYDDQRQALVMTAQRDIAAGEALHLSYGNKCNSRFFLNHGFCEEHNEENCAEIDLPDAAREHPLAGAAWVFGYPGYEATRRFRVPPNYGEWGTKQMFSFLRLSCARGEDVRRFVQGGLDRPEIAPVSRANETSVLLTLADGCHVALDAFATPLEDDLELLHDKGLSANGRNCILMRSGEKRVLRAYVELVDWALATMQSGEIAGPGSELPAALAGFGDYRAELAALP